MIKQLAHVCIHSRDMERTRKFYECLGANVRFRFEKEGALFGYYMALGNTTFIEIFEGDAATTGGAINHICLEVDDIDAVAKALKRHRVKTSKKTKGVDHSWQMWCKDPNGLRIEFHQYTQDSCQLIGGTVQANW